MTSSPDADTQPDPNDASREAVDALLTFYRKNGAAPGAADLLAVGEDPEFVLVSTAALILLTMRDSEGTPAISGVVIAVGPDVDAEDAQARVRHVIHSVIATRWQTPPRPAEIEEILGQVRVVRTDTFVAEGLVDLVRRVPAHGATLVTDGLKYRSGAVVRDSVPATEADTWAPHVRWFIEATRSSALEPCCYLAVSLGARMPADGTAHDVLMTIDNCGVLQLGESPTPRLTRAMLLQWEAMVQAGELGAALTQIDALATSDQSLASLLRLHMLIAGRFELEATAELAALQKDLDAFSDGECLQLAHQAAQLREWRTAIALLERSVPHLDGRELLEQALSVAVDVGHGATITMAEARLARLHPTSAFLQRHRVDAEVASHVAAQRYREAAATLRAARGADTDAVEAAELWELIANHRGDDGDLPAAAVLAAVAERFPGRLDEMRSVVAQLLARAGDRRTAVAVLLPPLADAIPPTTAHCMLALSIVERGRYASDATVDDAVMQAVVWACVLRLAEEPNAVDLRARLSRILQRDVSGTTGLTVLVWVVLALSGRAKQIDSSAGTMPAAHREDVEESQLTELIERGGVWVAQESILALGQLTFPAELIETPVDATVDALKRLLKYQSEQVNSADDERAVRVALGLFTAIAKLGTRPDVDLELVHLVMARLAIIGRAQGARDLAEHPLHVAGADPRRRRFAWFIFADVYARLGQHIEAMIAMAAALAAEDRATWEQVWDESTLLVRILRGAGISSFASPILARARSALPHIGHAGPMALRLEVMEAQLAMEAMTRSAQWDRDVLAEHLHRVTDLARRVLDAGDEIAPVASVLASVLQHSDAEGVNVSDAAREMLQSMLPYLSPLVREIIALASVPAPPVDRLVEIAGRALQARYGADLGFDMNLLALLARRVLASGGGDDASAVAYAIEATASHGIARPGDPDWSQHLLLDVHAPLRAAQAIAQEALAVVLLGWDGGGVTRVECVAGAVAGVAREPVANFDAARLHAWETEFPYGYRDSPDPNVFFRSTAGIGLSSLPSRAVVVTSVRLQAVPVNLLNVDDDLAGSTRALATAPSLSWLQAAQASPWASDGRRVAWIPTAEPEGPLQALAVLAERLQPTLVEHGVEQLHEERPPARLAGCELVIVGAHGGTSMENRFFLGVQDDTQVGLGASRLAQALAGAGIVVLFVCSGGRLDPHPDASAVVGLVATLLDEGCRAVIAPPWPLEGVVPPYWLPTFLHAWESGAAVIDACFAANGAVRERLGANPGQYLAMTVYGDPLASISARPDLSVEAVQIRGDS
jgi:hypothetical protein